MKAIHLLVLLLAAQPCAHAQTACPPENWPAEALVQLKFNQWRLDDAGKRNALALNLLPCMADASAELRDGIAFEGLSTWLRARQLSKDTQLGLFHRLLPQLRADVEDLQGFKAPFSALVLSEVARADRISPFLLPRDRSQLVDAATGYLIGIDDYRGFIAGEGWRHGVAHGSDLLMQLAHNDAVDRSQLERIVNAVRSQISPAKGHSYIFGESGRLARPVLYAARRNQLDAAWWQNWVRAVASPAPFPNWNAAFDSTAGLARLHNTKSFLLELYANVQESKSDALMNTLLQPLREALQELP